MKHKLSTMGRVAIALVLALSLSLVMAVPVAAVEPVGTPTIDGVIDAGEWDGALEIPVADGMGTVKLLASTDYLYVLVDVLDSDDARLGQTFGNDQTSININPTLGVPWGMPCDIIFQMGADPNAWGGTSSGTTDGWETDWQIDGVQQMSLPEGLETMTLYDGTTRISEWKLPLASIAPSPGDTLRVAGAIDVGDQASHVYPVDLDWADSSTYVDYSFIVENETTGLYYQTIQAAIDSAQPEDTVNVTTGTYNEYILIDKALTVRSTDGAEETIIDGIGFRYMVRIYSSDVTFEGFTVTNPTYEGGSDATGILVGAYLGEPVDNVHILDNIVTQVRSETGAPSAYGATGINVGRGPLSNVVISGNTITDIHNPDGASVDHTCGINVWDGAEGVEISNNTISDIKYNGILLQRASNVRIEGNSITECEVGIRVEPFEEGAVSGLTANFNSIAGNTEYGVANFDLALSVDAENNWWSSANGPGQDGANGVSGDVDFSPWLPGTWQTYFDETFVEIDTDEDGFSDLQEYWLGTDPKDELDKPGADVDEVANAYAPDGGTASTETTNAAVVADAAEGQSASVNLAEYGDTPIEEESVFGAVGSYVDVHCDNPESLEEVEIRVNYDPAITGVEELSLRMYYWDAGVGAWRQCSDQGVDIDEDFIWAKIRWDTTPDLDYLGGGPFGGGPASVELDSDWYKTGDTVEVTVEDVTANLDPIRTDEVDVIAISDSDIWGIDVTLGETGVNTGIFEGTFPLVAPPPPEPGPDQLVVMDFDDIVVVYIGAWYIATVDDTLPSWAVSGPSGTITDATPDIVAFYFDDHSGIDTATVVMTVDGSPVTPDEVMITEVRYTPSVDLSEGKHDVDVDFSDVAGNPPSHSAAWSFTVDTIKPKLDIGLAPDPPYTAEGTITFTLTFSEDMDTGVAPTVTFGLDDPFDIHSVTGGWTDLSLTEWVGTFVIDGTWDIGDDGEQTLSVSGAKDEPGNVMGTDTSTTFIVDLNAPGTPDLVSPGDAAVIEDTTTPEFEWSAVTDVSEVTYQLQVDDAADFLSPELDVSDIEATTYTEALENAEYSWRVRAIDGVGNLGGWSVVRTFTLQADAIVPLVTIITPNGDEVWQGGSEQTISWTAEDNITPLADLRVNLWLSRGGPHDEQLGDSWMTVADGEITLEAGVFSYAWTVPDYNNDHCSIRVHVKDLQNNSNVDYSDGYFTIATPVTFEFGLVAGWNLISMPMIPDDSAIGTILAPIADEVDIVWGYDAVNSPGDPWAYYKPGVVEDDLTLMVDGMGYWLCMGDPANLGVSGVVMPEPPAVPPVYDVASGWNLIGFKSTESILHSTYLLNIEGAYSVLWGYASIGGYFNVWPTGDPDEFMDPGRGYWLWATQDGIVVPPQ